MAFGAETGLDTRGNDPEYLRYSHPISGITPNRGPMYMGRAVADAIDIGAETGAKVAGKAAEIESYEKGEQMNTQLDAVVDPLYRQLVKGENPNENTTLVASADSTKPTNPSLLPAESKDIPPEVTAGTKAAASLNERFKNGKITETDYDAEINTLSKKLNAKFPGFQADIARGLQRATGRDNANLSVGEKIRDINAILKQLGDTNNKTLNEIWSTKWSDPAVGAKLADDFQKGLKTTNEVMYQVFRQRAVYNNIDLAKGQHEVDKGNRESNEWQASDNADKVAHSVTEDWRQRTEIAAGVGTPEELEKKALKFMQNPNDPEAQQVLQQYALSIPLYRKQLTQSLQPFVKDLGGPAKLQALVDTYAKPFEDQLALWSDPQKVGSVLYAQKHMADAMQRRQEGLISQSELGQQLTGIGVLTKLNADVGAKLATEQLMSRPDFTDKANKLIQSFKYSALGAEPESRTPPVAADAIEKTYGINPNPKVVDDYINFLGSVKYIKDPATIRKIAYAYYGPKNLGMVADWARESFDPRTGATEKGQINYFKRMADPEVLNAIKSVGDPTLNRHVQNFLEQGFSQNIFPGLMNDVESMTKGAGDRLGFEPGEGGKAPRFYLNPGPSGRLASSTFIQNTVHKLNFALESMGNAADFAGIKDKSGYALGLIIASNPNAFQREVKGFPGDINKAIANQILARKMEEERKAANKENLKEK